MTQKSKDNFPKTPSIKQIALIAVICLVTAILAAILPWVLNAINPTPEPTVLAPTFKSLLILAVKFG